MNYVDLLATEIQRMAESKVVLPDDDASLYRLYAVLLLAKGQEVTAEDVHNAWVAWASDHEPDNRSLRPFKELSLETQRKDDRFVEAIHQVAANMRLTQEETQ